MPKIAYKSARFSSGKEELYGHNCFTQEQMQEYCNHFPGSFEIVEDDFDFGTFVPEDQQPRKPWLDKDGNPVKITPARRAAIEAVLAALTKPL